MEIDLSTTFPSRRKAKRAKKQANSLNLEMVLVKARTENQKKAFHSYYSGQNLLLHGVAGTGKSYIAMYLALSDILNDVDDKKQVFIVRSTVASRDMGFLPGNKAEKSKEFEIPYQSICSDLFHRGDAYEVLKNRKLIAFEPTSFLRGETIRDSIMIIDEIQNMNWQEISTVLTRVGENTRVIMCGDYRQSDLDRERERQGIFNLLNVIKEMKSVDHVEFQIEDIQRSGFCREFLIAVEKAVTKNVRSQFSEVR